MSLHSAKRSLLALWLTTTIVSQVTWAQTSAPSSSDHPERESIARAVASAKATGNGTAFIPGGIMLPTGVKTVTNAAEHYSWIIAEPISETSLVTSPHSIDTWYLLNIVEMLRTQLSIPNDVETIPTSIKAPGRNQLLLATSGGEVAVDGVTVRQQMRHGMPMKLHSEYLLILHLQADGKTSQLATSEAAFEVDKDTGTLTSIDPSAPLANDFESNYHSDLPSIRAKLASVPQK